MGIVLQSRRGFKEDPILNLTLREHSWEQQVLSGLSFRGWYFFLQTRHLYVTFKFNREVSFFICLLTGLVGGIESAPIFDSKYINIYEQKRQLELRDESHVSTSKFLTSRI